jgi:hypothetical protein
VLKSSTTSVESTGKFSLEIGLNFTTGQLETVEHKFLPIGPSNVFGLLVSPSKAVKM